MSLKQKFKKINTETFFLCIVNDLLCCTASTAQQGLRATLSLTDLEWWVALSKMCPRLQCKRGAGEWAWSECRGPGLEHDDRNRAGSLGRCAATPVSEDTNTQECQDDKVCARSRNVVEKAVCSVIWSRYYQRGRGVFARRFDQMEMWCGHSEVIICGMKLRFHGLTCCFNHSQQHNKSTVCQKRVCGSARAE